MKRSVDIRCACGYEEHNLILSEDEHVLCPNCHARMEQIWWGTSKRNAQWDDSTSVLVHVSRDPARPADTRVRYPGQHSAAVPEGYERVYLRSLADVNRFEREHKVVNHVMHYDRNGRALDDTHFGKRMVD